MKTITREELKAKMDRGDDFVLLKVLGEASNKRIAPAGRDPLSRRERGPALFPDRSSEIIAYCSSFD